MLNHILPVLINYRDDLKKFFPQLIGYIVNGELVIKIKSQKILRVLNFLKNHTNAQFKILSDICAVDYPFQENRFEVVYNLLSINYNARITIVIAVDEKTPVDSCTDLYSAAG
jgi:NADH dehydrogenase (ubiquinone) Fe-S protein 3